MPYDKLIQRGDVAAFTSDTTRRGKTDHVANRVIERSNTNDEATRKLNAQASRRRADAATPRRK